MNPTNTTQQATPSCTPWYVGANKREVLVRDSFGTYHKAVDSCSLPTSQQEANAALIVRAVNLFAAHESVAEAAKKYATTGDCSGGPIEYHPCGKCDYCTLKSALATLEKVKGEQE